MNDFPGRIESEKGPVECLGQTFPNDDARGEHFLNLMVEKREDQAFRNQEGFPKGTDEAILAMSDPPYYTACLNPWLADFVACYDKLFDPSEGYPWDPLAGEAWHGVITEVASEAIIDN